MKKCYILLLLSMVLFSCSSKKEYKVRMYTTAGDIDLVLYDETPAHRDNFVRLVKESVYDSLLFHRVISGFMIQGGDPDSKTAPAGALLGEGDLGYSIEAEIMPDVHFHKRGVLAAAREGDDVNPQKASSASQFYIVWGRVYTREQLEQMQDFYRRRGNELTLSPAQIETYTTIGGTPHLDGGYTVFGEVVQGLDVVEKIQNVPCDANDRPLQDIRIIKVEFIK